MDGASGGGDASAHGRCAIAARLFDAFNRRDLDAALVCLDPQIVFAPVTASVLADGHPYCCHDGIRRYMADVQQHWHTLTVEPAQIRAAGDAVVVLGRVSGAGDAGSFRDVPLTCVLKFRGALVARAQVFFQERAARDALGTTETSV
jgi:ketosteroid isomerase-like protein